MKIAILSSHTPSLFWFRLDMMKLMQERGHQVVAIGNEPEEQWRDKFLEYNIEYRRIYVERNGLNPINDFRTFYSILRVLKQIRPEKIFIYQAKTIVYGSIASRFAGVREIFLLIAGLGSVFRGRGAKNKILRFIMIYQYKLASKLSKGIFIQNNDDRDLFISYGISKSNKITMINGSGVNLELFKPTPFPDRPVFLFVGRLIRDKGIMEYLEASRIIKKSFPNVRCLLVGPFDSNPTALNMNDLNEYLQDGSVEYFGETSDVKQYLGQCSVFVLPSYHEGTPKSVLEAMATGRPIITTDAPGCRETVQEGVNGFLVPVKDSDSLVEKMTLLIEKPDLIPILGKRSLEICIKKYDVKKVNQCINRAMEL